MGQDAPKKNALISQIALVFLAGREGYLEGTMNDGWSFGLE